MTVIIMSYTPAARTATIHLEDGTILTVPVLVDFTNYIGQTAAYDNGLLTLTPQPPVTIVSADPTTIIDGTLIYNTTAAALKVGRSGAWVTI